MAKTLEQYASQAQQPPMEQAGGRPEGRTESQEKVEVGEDDVVQQQSYTESSPVK